MYLLRVDCTFQLSEIGIWVNGSQEDGLVLVHSSIGEEKGRV